MTNYIYIREDITKHPETGWIDIHYSLVFQNKSLEAVKPRDRADEDWTEIVNIYRVELTTAVELYLLQHNNRGNQVLETVLKMEQARAALYSREFRLGEDGIYRMKGF